MPRAKPSSTSVGADALRALVAKGASSPIIEARLDYTEIEGVARYVRMMQDAERVHPMMLPTQASGRWSTTDPPIITFPHDCINPACPKASEPHVAETEDCWSAQDLVGPDEGWWWLEGDADAIEGKISAADAGDELELESYVRGWDVHTLAACGMFKVPFPPDRTKACHTADSCAAWRALWDPPWAGALDRRRHLAKTMKYATQFCLRAEGVLDAKDIQKLGLERDELVDHARAYIRSRQVLQRRKEQVWEESVRTSVSYTWYGRRRYLFGDDRTKMKEGWSHRISGTVTDMVNEFLIYLARTFPDTHLALNKHDGWAWAFPGTYDPQGTIALVRPHFERERTSPSGHTFLSTGSWGWVDDQFRKHHV